MSKTTLKTKILAERIRRSKLDDDYSSRRSDLKDRLDEEFDRARSRLNGDSERRPRRFTESSIDMPSRRRSYDDESMDNMPRRRRSADRDIDSRSSMRRRGDRALGESNYRPRRALRSEYRPSDRLLAEERSKIRRERLSENDRYERPSDRYERSSDRYERPVRSRRSVTESTRTRLDEGRHERRPLRESDDLSQMIRNAGLET